MNLADKDVSAVSYKFSKMMRFNEKKKLLQVDSIDPGDFTLSSFFARGFGINTVYPDKSLIRYTVWHKWSSDKGENYGRSPSFLPCRYMAIDEKICFWDDTILFSVDKKCTYLEKWKGSVDPVIWEYNGISLIFAEKPDFSRHSFTRWRMAVKILIAEDELTTRMLVQVSLENWGYRVESVVNGQQAWLALKRKDAPSIAILDWEMPELNGPEVCRKVKEMGKENSPYIILLTGRDSSNDIVKGFDAGADDYMTKPFNNNELQARVRVAERMVRTQTSLAESVAELKEVLNHLEMIREGVAVCQSCRKIYNSDDGSWYTIEESASNYADPRFFQAVCPNCTPNSPSE